MVQVGRQAAHFAAAIGNIEVFKLLVDTYKVSVNVTDKVFLYYMYQNHVYLLLSIVCTYVCIHDYGIMYLRMYTYVRIQWNLSIMDTLGPAKSVQIIKVS